ncbi:zinc ribbon domain-containing protein (plasmid) [Deinococcus radiomollis]|uniref:zinc ribbon domain-containing protein n=1 Tax=Deinococcus radiomollis TaxID=468916 RepID=UPI003891EB44
MKPASCIRSTPLRPDLVWDARGAELLLELFEERCAFLLDLTREVSNLTSQAWWTPGHFTALTAGVGLDGKKLPMCGNVAARRLGWKVEVPVGVYVPDRFRWGVKPRLIALWRARRDESSLLTAMLPLIDAAGEYDASTVRATPAGQWATNEELLRLSRAVMKFRGEHDRVPAHLTDAFNAPVIRSPVFPLSCTDKQLVTMTVLEDALLLRLKLPIVARPRVPKDWVWHTARLPIPEARRELGAWSLPDIRMQNGKLLFSAAQTSRGDEWYSADRVVWSPSALVVAAVVEKRDDVLLSSGQATGFDDAGRISKALRLQQEEQLTRRKWKRIENLLTGQKDDFLAGRYQRLGVQLDHLSRKRSKLNLDLAWHAANHLVDVATSTGASMVIFENLQDFDSTGRGAFQNNRNAQSVRGQVYSCTEQLAARQGIEVVQVPPRGASAWCAGCDAVLDRPEGYHSAACPACGLSGGRDVMAAVNIGKRGLLGKNIVSRPKGRPKRIRTVLHESVTLSDEVVMPMNHVRPMSPTRTDALPERRLRVPKGGLTREMRAEWRAKDAERKAKQQAKSSPARLSPWGMVERTRLRVDSSHMRPEASSEPRLDGI